MSVRVNLLPGELASRERATRARGLAAAAGALLLAILGLLYFLQMRAIGDAQERLAATQAETTALQADIAALQPFADLEQRALSAADTVSAAMAREASVAAILQDLSAVLPPDAELLTLSVTIDEAPVAPSAGGTRLAHGRISAAGRTTGGIAPGVERLLIDFGRVASFDNVYVTSSSVDDEGVATFALEIELGPEVLTERYHLRDVAVTP